MFSKRSAFTGAVTWVLARLGRRTRPRGMRGMAMTAAQRMRETALQAQSSARTAGRMRRRTNAERRRAARETIAARRERRRAEAMQTAAVRRGPQPAAMGARAGLAPVITITGSGGLVLLLVRSLRMRRARGEDVVALLTSRHREAERLVERWETTTGMAERAAVLEQMRRFLSIHEAVEEQIVHPVVRRSVPNGDALVTRVLAQEQEAKQLLATLERTQPGSADMDRLVSTLASGLRAHIATEEGEVFPGIITALDSGERMRLGAMVARAERMAPTHPHPKAPSTPPANVLVGVPVAAIDRARDAVKAARKE